MNQCETCGHSWTGPGYDQDIVQNVGCPNCGSFRTQVSPTHSEMEIRDAPLNGKMDDMGGNPLQEGVWGSIDGGWKNRMKRDESFASIRTAAVSVVPFGGNAMGFHNDPHMGVMEMANFLEKNGKGTLHLNGQPYQSIMPSLLGTTEPIEVSHPFGPAEGKIAQMIEAGNAGVWRAMKQKMQQPKAASIRTADDFDFDDLFADDDNPYQPPQVAERFIVNPQGQMIRPDQGLVARNGGIENVHHEELAAANGIRGEGGQYPGHSLGQVYNNGTLEMLTLDPAHTQNIKQTLGEHFPEYQHDLSRFEDSLGGGLQAQDNEQRWNREIRERGQQAVQENQGVVPAGMHPNEERYLPGFDQRKQQEMTDVAERGRPFGYYDNPYFNRGGSARETIYLPWTRETSSVEHDFEVTQVVPPGPSTEEVDMGESNPLILQHDDPKLLTDAKHKLESATKTSFLPLLLGLGAGALAGEGAAALGAGAGANMLARGAVSGLVRGALQGGQGGAAGGSAPQPMPQQEVPTETLASIHQQLTSAFDGPFDNHPSSDQGLNERADGNPDDVDPHEFGPDEDALAKDDTGGGTDGFSPDVMQALQDAEPALLHYFKSEESGFQDPAISHLIEALERDHPGLLDEEPSPEAQELLKTLHTSAVPMPGVPGVGMQVPAPGTQALQAPIAQPQQQVDPTTQASCPHCGARLTAGQGVCPQCNGSVALEPNTPQAPMSPQPGMQQPQQGMPVTAAGQGPQSIEQVQAVVQLLQQQGRDDEIAQVVLNPDAYADELAEVAGRNNPPAPDPAPGPPPPAPDPSQMGMPPGGAMPPGAAPPMPMQANRQAADSVATKCPNCGSHTTGVVSEDGDMECSNCKHSWQKDIGKQIDIPIQTPKGSKVADLHPHVDALGVPAADQAGQDDPAKDQNPGSWVTESGEPLKVGREYEMHSARYDIPDIVRIENIKPDEIEYTLTGEYNLAHRTTISKEEAQMDGTTFSALGADPDENLNEQTPNDQMAPPILSKVAGKKFTPMEQREFIDEPGVARNADKLDLANTHYTDEQSSLLTDDYFLFL